jgi:hypothetical protein
MESMGLLSAFGGLSQVPICLPFPSGFLTLPLFLNLWHGKSSLGSLEARSQLAHLQGAYAASCTNVCYLTTGGVQVHGQRW